MAYIITKVRELIDDAAGADQVFSDQQIQDTLDARRRRIVREPLTPVSAVSPAGVTSYSEFYSRFGYWETDIVVQDGSYADIELDIDDADYRVGKFTFLNPRNPPVFLSGVVYDLYGAAADMLEQWLAKVKTDYDFLSSGRTFKRSQQADGIERLMKMYRNRQWVTHSLMVRTDMNY
jgi:hypothetical protein